MKEANEAGMQHGLHHAHGEGCGCGHHTSREDHANNHHPHHEHAHDGECGCGGNHQHIQVLPAEGMSTLQQNMLLALYERRYLPVTRFTMTSTKDESIYAIALAPVYMGSAEDGMEQVKALGAELKQLEQGGLITLDYDIFLDGYTYREYDTSALYQYFVDTVEESATQPETLFDIANLEKGSMALTEAGMKRAEEMISASL